MNRTLSALLLTCVALAGVAGAQEAYPTRPVTIVVPFPPGGIADLTARPLAPALERVLKQPVVVANKAGAAGAVGMQSVAIARPDGYTVMVALVSISTIPEVAAALEKVLKAPVGVVNKQRAAGAVGMQSVATGTPEPVLAKLRDAARAAVEEPSFKAAMDKLETPIVFKQGEEFRRFFEADARRLGEGVRRVGKVETQ